MGGCTGGSAATMCMCAVASLVVAVQGAHGPGVCVGKNCYCKVAHQLCWSHCLGDHLRDWVTFCMHAPGKRRCSHVVLEPCFLGALGVLAAPHSRTAHLRLPRLLHTPLCKHLTDEQSAGLCGTVGPAMYMSNV